MLDREKELLNLKEESIKVGGLLKTKLSFIFNKMDENIFLCIHKADFKQMKGWLGTLTNIVSKPEIERAFENCYTFYSEQILKNKNNPEELMDKGKAFLGMLELFSFKLEKFIGEVEITLSYYLNVAREDSGEQVAA